MADKTVDENLEWIRVRNELYDSIQTESFKEKFIRKMSENPVVPVGVLATVSALAYGLWNCYTGNSKMAQYMMRTRVAAQGLTILATAVGFVIVASRKKE